MAGAANAAADCIPWIIEHDRESVIMVDEGGSKSIRSIAHAMCDAVRARGVPEVTMVDHDLTQIVVAFWPNALLVAVKF